MEKKRSRFGIGPLWAIITVSLGIVTIVLGLIYSKTFHIAVEPGWILPCAGIILLIVGVIIYIPCIKQMRRAYNSGELATTGVYGMCRNPVYAVNILFIAPGIALVFANWLALLVPPVMWLILAFMVRKEEESLLHEFGDAYKEYRKLVPMVLPIGGLYRKKR